MEKKSEYSAELIAQRKLGAKLAAKYKASRAMEAVKDMSKSHGDILQAAADDVGADKLAEIILTEHPEWAFHAVKDVSQLRGNEALIAKAQEWMKAQSTPQALTAETVYGVGNVAVELVWGSVMYTCQYTMFWESATNVIQPQASQLNPGAWVWSPKMDITYHSGYRYDCAHFQIPTSSIAKGNPVWVHLSINGGGSHDIGKGGFVYQPGGGTMLVKAGGTTLGPKLTAEYAYP